MKNRGPGWLGTEFLFRTAPSRNRTVHELVMAVYIGRRKPAHKVVTELSCEDRISQ